ncbi:MAG: O-acetylhomoserine aminocarboxypropyltransferase [Verrucomicrobiota bacterium]
MAENSPDFRFDTQVLHAGAQPDPTTGSRTMPIHQTTSFVFKDSAHAARLFNLEEVGFIYSRLTNPTVSALEARVAALEGGVGATATSSGHAAQILAFFPLMEPGDHIVAARKLYGGSINQMSHAYKRFGWEVTFVDSEDPENFRKAATPRTKAFFMECLANPGGVVCDIGAVARIADDLGLPLVVDNTMATPALCRPIEHGATLVVNSSTKFLQGHGAAVGGVVVDSGKFDWLAHADKFPSLGKPAPEYHGTNFAETFGSMAFTFHGHAVGLRDLGPCQSPQNAFLTLQGIETLSLRMERHCSNALKVAQYLEGHAKVDWVSYAGLPSSPYHALAQQYLPKGAGAVFTLGLKGGYEAGVELVSKFKLFTHLANIGDTRSLVIHPASTTHRQVPKEELGKVGADPEVIRLSIGIEDVEDIIADLEQALA